MRRTLVHRTLGYCHWAWCWMLIGWGTWPVHGQETSSPPTNDPAAFATDFWGYLKRAQYRNWAPAPGRSADFKTGIAQHGKYAKLYVNRLAYANMDELPYGSILLQEDYNAEKSLEFITVLYRSKGTAPEDNDWYWIKYRAQDGTVVTRDDDDKTPLSGRIQSCIDCHQRAKDKDFVFANDKS